jgi:methylmalonyl-CoA/ethylmalonyl-CoA epimerase
MPGRPIRAQSNPQLGAGRSTDRPAPGPAIDPGLPPSPSNRTVAFVDEQFGLHAIGQILVPVSDLERAVAFYRDELRMPFLFQYPGMGFFDCDGVRLFLGVPEAGQILAPVTIYYRVDDLDGAVATLESRGVTFDHGPHLIHRTPASELWMASLRDPDGNPVVLMNDRPHEIEGAS